MKNLPNLNRAALLKIGMIPVLALVLAWVLLGRGEPDVAELADPASAPRRPRTRTVVAASTSALPRPSLEDLVATNPFAPLASASSATTAPLSPATPESTADTGTAATIAEANKTELQPPTLRVHAVLRTPTGLAVLTDAGILHEGDTVDGKFRVVTISESGVTFDSL